MNTKKVSDHFFMGITMRICERAKFIRIYLLCKKKVSPTVGALALLRDCFTPMKFMIFTFVIFIRDYLCLSVVKTALPALRLSLLKELQLVQGLHIGLGARYDDVRISAVARDLSPGFFELHRHLAENGITSLIRTSQRQIGLPCVQLGSCRRQSHPLPSLPWFPLHRARCHCCLSAQG